VKNELDLQINNFKARDSYRKRWRSATDLITWGVKWKCSQYRRGGKNVLYCENGLLKQSQGIYINTNGYFGSSSIVQDKEYLIEPTDEEKENLKSHIKKCFNIDFNKERQYDPNGPILVPLQMNRDASMRHYFPFCKSPERVATHLQACFDNMPKTWDMIIRNQPREKRLPANIQIPRNYIIDNSGDFMSMAKKCSGIIAVNSTVVTECLALGIPVATLGRGAFYGSNVTLDCSSKPERISDVRFFEPNFDDIERYLCAVLRHQISYNSPIHETLKYKSIIKWLDILTRSRNKKIIEVLKPKKKSEIEISVPNKNIQEEINKKKIAAKKKKVKTESLYDFVFISHERGGKRYLSSIFKNHLQVNSSKVGVFSIHDDIEVFLKDNKCKVINSYKNNLFNAYCSMLINEKNPDYLPHIRLRLNKTKCMQWMIKTREKIRFLEKKCDLSLNLEELTKDKIDDLFINLELMALLSLNTKTKKNNLDLSTTIKSYNEIKREIEMSIGLYKDSESILSDPSILRCRRCKNKSIDKSSTDNSCLHCGYKNSKGKAYA